MSLVLLWRSVAEKHKLNKTVQAAPNSFNSIFWYLLLNGKVQFSDIY